MIIATQQLEVLGAPHKEAFIEKTIAFLRKECAEWAGDREYEELRASVESMIEVGRQYDIQKEINVQKLLYHYIMYQLEVPFGTVDAIILNAEGHSENYRVKRWIQIVRRSHG